MAHELDCLKAIGVRQAILIDLTRPGIDIPVVRMVVPGLEGWADKAEGRRARRAPPGLFREQP